jgi:hypothetical protein
MNTSQLFVLDPSELAKMAQVALQDNNEDLLKHIDFAFHHIFLLRSKRGSEKSRLQYIDAMLDITQESGPELLASLPYRQSLLHRWEHLAQLMEAFRHDRDRVAEARRLVDSRKWATEIIKELKANLARGEPSLKAKDLAKRINITSQGLSPLLNELEQQDIIERHRFGRFVFVSLGLVGQLLGESLPDAAKPATSVRDETQDSFWIKNYRNDVESLAAASVN